MAAFETPETRSPLKRNPLRNPGDSVQDEIDRLLVEKLFPLYVGAAMAVTVAALEWWRYLSGSPPHPVPITVLAVLAIVYFALRFAGALREARSLRLGRDGERIVGQSLEDLRSDGFRVFHDLPGSGFNIDHVIVGPKGIFAVETKTFSKPGRGKAVVDWDGTRVLVNGYTPSRDPIVQARASASWIRDLLLETTGRAFEVRPVVLFPGWFVESPKGSQSRVWVLNPKALPAFLEHAPVTLSGEDVALIASRLTDRAADRQSSGQR